MVLKRIFLGALVAVLVAAAWRYRHADWVTQLLSPKDTRPARIQFDNGTVRAMALPASGPDGQTPLQLPAAAMRKCLKAGRITYTNEPCPAGAKELAMGQGSLSVLPSQKPPSATEANQRLGLGDAQSLKDKQMDRVIGQ
jgi:hypothetical protein